MKYQTVINRIGGGNLRETARILDLPVTTVHSWKNLEEIPKWREDHIRKVAKSIGVDVDD